MNALFYMSTGSDGFAFTYFQDGNGEQRTDSSRIWAILGGFDTAVFTGFRTETISIPICKKRLWRTPNNKRFKILIATSQRIIKSLFVVEKKFRARSVHIICTHSEFGFVFHRNWRKKKRRVCSIGESETTVYTI